MWILKIFRGDFREMDSSFFSFDVSDALLELTRVRMYTIVV
jgi:hypothetical protein